MSKLIVSVLTVACALFAGETAWAQERQVTGRVTSAVTGEGVPGAAVSVKGTGFGTITDEAGSFAFRVPPGELVLVVQTLGYRTAEVALGSGQTSASVSLEVDVLAIDELVVTGQATSVSRRNLAHAVSTVSAAEITRAPAATVEKAIQGKVAGAMISANSGAPGGGVQVQLRGVSTINALSEPLYVIDGMIVSNAEIPSNANAVTKAAGGSNPSLKQDAVVNRIVDVNPNDIARIEILKGASAAAIYGSRASNGVIIITTKRGRPGAPRINVTQRFGVFDLSNKIGFRSYETVDEALSVFTGEDATAADSARIRQIYGDGTAYDLEELLAGRHDLSTETAFSVSGGSETTQYYASGIWKDDAGVIANTGFEKQGVRLNLDQQLGSRVDVSVHTNMLHTVAERGLTNNDNSGTSFYMALTGTPNFVDLRRNPDGTFPDNPFERSNPLETANLMENAEDVWRFMSSATLDYEAVTSGAHTLRVSGNGGVDYFTQENELYFPPELQFEPSDGQPGTSLLSNSNNLNLTATGNVIYTYAPLRGTFAATTSAGIQYADQDLNIGRIVSRNLIPGQRHIDAGTNIEVSEARQRVKDLGIYVQEELLALDDRLLLTAGVRADRSSVNGDPAGFFVYPKASASYRFPEVSDALDELKLRVALGQSGNRPLFGQKFTPLVGSRNIEGLPGLIVTGTAGDPEIEPERQTEVETGFDATLFDGRATLEFTVYQRDVTNLLLQRELAPSSGFTTQFFNGGELRVRGVEVALAATPVQARDFTWVASTTFFTNRSEIVELPVPAFRTGGFGTALGAFEIREGRSATQIVSNAGLDENGDVVVKQVGDANPDFKMALVNDLSYKDFNFYFLWDWQQGGTLINLTKLLYDLAGNWPDYDQNPKTETIAGITVEGTEGERRLGRFLNGDTRPYIEDASYVKLREASLSYALPPSLVTGLLGERVEGLRLTLSGRNLLTFTEYTGLDPEVSNFGNQPIARNIDVSPFPPSRSFWLSVDVSF